MSGNLVLQRVQSIVNSSSFFFSLNKVTHGCEDSQALIFLDVNGTHFCGDLCPGIMQCFLPAEKEKQ